MQMSTDLQTGFKSRETISGKPLITLIQSDRQKFADESSRNHRTKHTFSFIDLFAGVGGLRRGFDAVGGRCVFTSEWNKYARRTYMANYHDGDDHIMAGDITSVDAAGIPGHDLLLAGFPCQPFSIAGVSKRNALGHAHGFCCETQGTLFFDVVRILKHHRPNAFLLENVKNLVNHDKGNTFRIIRKMLKDELGYLISWRVIDAKGLLPQHRERIFIAGFRDSTDFSLDDVYIPEPAEGPRLGSILHREGGSEGADMHYADRRGRVNSKYTLSDKLWQYLKDYAERHRRRGNGFGFGLFGPDDVARTLSARYYKDSSEILIRQKRRNPRRLTPRECSRLMGFDVPRGSDFQIPVSDNQAYRQFGNAVAVPVVERLARHMVSYIIESKEVVPPALDEGTVK